MGQQKKKNTFRLNAKNAAGLREKLPIHGGVKSAIAMSGGGCPFSSIRSTEHESKHAAGGSGDQDGACGTVLTVLVKNNLSEPITQTASLSPARFVGKRE
jgi:hypothetical protein